MGVEGPDFKGLNDLELVSQYYSVSAGTKEGNERYTLSISLIQCRGLIASHHFRLGRSLVFVVCSASPRNSYSLQRLLHMTEQQQTRLVTSNLAPIWPDTLTITSQVSVICRCLLLTSLFIQDLQSHGIILEVIEYNWLIKRYCRLSINLIYRIEILRSPLAA